MAKRKIVGVTLQPRGKVTRKSIMTNPWYLKQLKACQKGGEIFPLDAPGLPQLTVNSALISTALADEDGVGTSEEDLIVVGKGSDGKRQTVLQDHKVLRKVVKAVLREQNTPLVLPLTGGKSAAVFTHPGHLWGGSAVTGPVPADVMVIGRNVAEEDFNYDQQRLMSDEASSAMLSLLLEARAKDVGRYYVTNLIKFCPPSGSSTLRADWVRDGKYLLYHELKIVQPKFILCLGADATKAILGPKASVTALEGSVSEFRYNIGLSGDESDPAAEKTARVVSVIHPRQAMRDQSDMRRLQTGVFRFSRLVAQGEMPQEEVNHGQVQSMEELVALLLEIEEETDPFRGVLAVDAEWHGEHPVNRGTYVRTIQMSWKSHHAMTIRLACPGGRVAPEFQDESGENLRSDLAPLLTAFFNGGSVRNPVGEGLLKFRRKRVVGHFFNADLEWLVDSLGIDIRKAYECPLRPLIVADPRSCSSERKLELMSLYIEEGFKPGDLVPAWFRTKYEGGADTGLMAHAVEETASFKLESLAMRYTDAPRYDKELREWVVSHCKEAGISSKDLEGYGECPDEILIPYGNYDADVTFRLYQEFDKLLDADYEGNNCREAFWESHIASPAILEIHRTGIPLNLERIDHLTGAFMKAKARIEEELYRRTSWPSFNVRSVQQVRELLFGEALNGKTDKETGKPVRLRPEGAISLALAPIFDTGTPPLTWSEVIERGLVDRRSPSTSKQVLSLLLVDNEISEERREVVGLVRDFRFLDQVLKTVLRVPVSDKDTGDFVVGEDGYFSYDDGLAAARCDDGRVHTHIYPTKETGRWASARPNLQNISKSRDSDYERLLGDDYCYSLRSVLEAPPGHVLLEADYIGAELFGMAIMSGDQNMLNHAMRNQLPQDHPDFYDIHSSVACFAFRLDCPPNKAGLKAAGAINLRHVAKSVIFGIAYGRGAKAIAVAAREQGIFITVDDAKKVIDAVFAMYPRLESFFETCRARASGQVSDEHGKPQRWLCSCFGRFRRFPDASHDDAMRSGFERQAMNFPIQSMIASIVSRAVAEMYHYRDRCCEKTGKDLFRILLQVHDAVLLSVPYEHVREVATKVIPRTMRNAVPIYPTSLDGMPTGEGPYYLGIEADVMKNWGEKLSYREAKSMGIPTGTWSKDGCTVNFSKEKK